jgi:hypothetical protein
MMGAAAFSRLKGGMTAQENHKWAEAGLAGFPPILSLPIALPPDFRGEFEKSTRGLNQRQFSRFVANWLRFVRICYLDHSFSSKIGAR